LDALVIAADEEFTVVQTSEISEAQLSKAKQLELCEAIKQYRLCLLDDLESPPLFGIEVATGITDQLIKDITTNICLKMFSYILV